MTDPSEAEIVSYRIDAVYEDGIIETIEIPLDQYMVVLDNQDETGEFSWIDREVAAARKKKEEENMRKRIEQRRAERVQKERERERYYDSPG